MNKNKYVNCDSNKTQYSLEIYTLYIFPIRRKLQPNSICRDLLIYEECLWITKPLHNLFIILRKYMDISVVDISTCADK